METYAAFLSHTDHHVGRVIEAIDELGVLENTLIYYIRRQRRLAGRAR